MLAGLGVGGLHGPYFTFGFALCMLENFHSKNSFFITIFVGIMQAIKQE
jgi:hypothetical protein